VAAFDPAVALDTHPHLLRRAYNRPRVEQLDTMTVDDGAASADEAQLDVAVDADADGDADADADEDAVPVKKPRRGIARHALLMEKEKAKKYKELTQRSKREHQLRQMRHKLETKRALLGKGRRKKVADADGKRAAVYEWKKERKR
jgi:hypothetical protein